MSLTASQYLNDQGVGQINEDKYLLEPDEGLFGVFDGATSLVPYTSPQGETGGLIAARIARDSFAKGTGKLSEIALQANRAIQAVHDNLKISGSNAARFSSTAAVVRINDGQAELLQIGDSVIIVACKDGRVKLPLGYHDHDLGIMRAWRKLADQGQTNIRQKIDSDLLTLRNNANKKYGSLNGDPAVSKFINYTSIPLTGISLILLLTDGMYLPKADPEAPEDWEERVKTYRDSGLQGLLDTVRALEDQDPDLLLYPRYKLHDDATAIALTLD